MNITEENKALIAGTWLFLTLLMSTYNLAGYAAPFYIAILIFVITVFFIVVAFNESNND